MGATKKADNYIGGSIGKTRASDFCTNLQDCNSGGTNWKVYAGVRLNDNIVMESGYTNFGKQSGKDGNGDVNESATATTVAGLATFSYNKDIEFFGKAGMARWNQTYSDSTGSNKSKGTDVLVGAGANYDLGDNIGLRAEWERYKDIGDSNHRSDKDLFSAGVTFSSL
jgi:hypothetical protein